MAVALRVTTACSKAVVHRVAGDHCQTLNVSQQCEQACSSSWQESVPLFQCKRALDAWRMAIFGFKDGCNKMLETLCWQLREAAKISKKEEDCQMGVMRTRSTKAAKTAQGQRGKLA